MSFEKTFFAFVIVLALTFNVSFVIGDMDRIDFHPVHDLALAIVVSLISTVMKFGDRSLLGSTMLATSLVADVQLIAAAVAWGMASFGGGELSPQDSVVVVSLAAGAVVANTVSVVLLLIETASLRR